MLPFDSKPWAPRLAKFVILFTIVAEIVTILWLRHLGPLDTGEIVALALVLIGVVPPNIHIIRRRPNERLEDYIAPPKRRPASRPERST